MFEFNNILSYDKIKFVPILIFCGLINKIMIIDNMLRTYFLFSYNEIKINNGIKFHDFFYKSV